RGTPAGRRAGGVVGGARCALRPAPVTGRLCRRGDTGARPWQDRPAPYHLAGDPALSRTGKNSALALLARRVAAVALRLLRRLQRDEAIRLGSFRGGLLRGFGFGARRGFHLFAFRLFTPLALAFGSPGLARRAKCGSLRPLGLRLGRIGLDRRFELLEEFEFSLGRRFAALREAHIDRLLHEIRPFWRVLPSQAPQSPSLCADAWPENA